MYKGAAPPGRGSRAAMRAPVCLLLAFVALARAASIPADHSVEKKIIEVTQQVLNKDPEPLNVSGEQELIDQQNIVKDIDNNLKQAAIDAIPVKVVVEDVKPALKFGDEKKKCDKADHDDDDNIKRVEVDLKHPGAPQRQEHDNQNPDPSENELDAATKIKQMIKNTQVAFNEGFKDISNGINDWLHDNEPKVSIKDSINNLQETFMDQINKLNHTIRSYWNPEEYKESEKPVSIRNVEFGLKVLEDSFESGVGNLTNGVRVLAALKSEVKDDPTTAKPDSNPIFPFFQSFFNGMTENFGNLTTQVQNFFNNQGSGTTDAASGTQSDDPATPRPTVWQGIQNSIQGILNRPGSQQQGGQSDEQTQAPSGPFAQVIQNNPFVQSVINFIQPKPPQTAGQTASPAPPSTASQAASDPQSTASEGSNAVPEKPVADQQKEKPEQAAQSAQAQPAQAQTGPIQQIIQRNPIVQGIQGAVQKIQHNINNPEKPREEAVESEKGGFHHGGHGGHRPVDEHNNDVDSSGVVKSTDEKETASAKEPIKKEEMEVQKENEAPIKQD